MGHKGPSHESSFMIKDRKKKKSMALFIKNLEHVQLISVPWGKICDMIKHVQFLLMIKQVTTSRHTCYNNQKIRHENINSLDKYDKI